MLLNRPHLRHNLDEFSPEYLSSSANREIFARWLECLDLEELQTSLDEPLLAHLQSLNAVDIVPIDTLESERALNQCMQQLKRRHLLELQQTLLETIDNATPPPRELAAQISTLNEGIRATELR